MFRMIYKVKALIILLIILSIAGKAQNQIDYLVAQFQRVAVSQKDSASFYINKLEASRDRNNESKILNCKAIYTQRWESDYKKGLKILDTALICAKDSADFYKALNTRANILKDLGKFPEAVKIYLNYLDYAKRNNKIKLIGKIYSNIGLVYAYANKDIDAIPYLKQALESFKTQNIELEYYRTSMILATSFFKLDSSRLAGKYLLAAAAYFKKTKDDFFYADAMKEYSTVKYDLNQYDSAIYYLNESYKIFKLQNAVEPLTLVSLNLSSCYKTIKNTKQAEYFADLGYAYAIENQAPDILMMATYNNYELYKELKSPNKALSFYELYVAYKDTFMNNEKENALNDLNIKYKTSEKDNELLRREVELNLNEKLIENKNKTIFAIATVLFFALALILIVLYFIRKQKALNRNLENLNAFKNKVFTIISHDLRSPMNSIINSSKDDVTKSNSLSVLHILDNLLHWSYPQLNNSQLNIKTIILNEILEEAISETTYLLKEKGQKIVLNIDEDFTFKGDYNTTLIIFRNLITNACKYSPINENIIISQKDKEITIYNKSVQHTITGSGIGIKLCQDLANQNNYKLTLDINQYEAKIILTL